MKRLELEYELPEALIAQEPAERRDASRLLVLERVSGLIRHERFEHLPQILPAGALLVLNDTRVLPARLPMRRATGGRVDGLFIREVETGLWEVMLTGSARLKTGEVLAITPIQSLRLKDSLGEGRWHAEPHPPGDTLTILNDCGLPPLPPYIKRDPPTPPLDKGGPEGVSALSHQQDSAPTPHSELRISHSDLERYQTIYARNPGAIAAPTAGLHFTPALFDTLRGAGFRTTFVTLHVGVGTFAPIRADDLRDHEMHAEWYECSTEAAKSINDAGKEGRPIVAVGTTSARVLETCADENGEIVAGSGWTQLFIYPPYRFKAVDAMLTNFHLPGSTLLAMIFALAGREAVLAAYREAIEQHYRFYSYGDAMLII